MKCYHCHGVYRLYGDMVQHQDANRCPFCGAEVKRSTWDKIIVPAWGTMEDANRDLQQEYTGYPNTTLFQIEYQAHKPQISKRPDAVFPKTGPRNPYENCPNIN